MLEARDINVSYGDLQVLFDVSLTVSEGEAVAIVGSNAAGKSTLLRAVSGLVPLRSGSIMLDGRPMDGLPAHQIARMGVVYVPEGAQVFPDMTVMENLEISSYQARARASRLKNLRTVFELFPILEERKAQRAGTLSGGERQMLAIGRGLMAAPRILMLDEPSLGLAPKLVTAIFDMTARINRMGIAIVLVEQNVRHALTITNRAYVLETGRVTLQGGSTDVLSDDRVREAYLGI